MKEYLKLAWRNIWRNKRRTIITTASVFFALFFALVMRSMQVGVYSHWTNSIVESFSGAIQIHRNGYWREQSIDNTFSYSRAIIDSVSKAANIKVVIPRLESFALASAGENTKGILVVGIDPEKEKKLSNPEKNLVEGDYLSLNDDGVLISQRLAEFLRIELNDTVTLLSQGYHGTTAAGIFPVRGIIKLPNPELDKRIIFMALPASQYFYDAHGMLTSLVINIKDTELLDETVNEISARLDNDKYEIMHWKELNKELVQQIESDQSSAFIMLGLLYLIVGFGVLGTLLMMIAERRKEFGVMVSIGMKKIKLGFVLLLEIIMLGIIGIFSAVIVSIPVIYYLNQNPIRFTGEFGEMYESYGIDPVLTFSTDEGFFIGQSVVVLVIFLIALIYPVYSTLRIKEVQALRA
jgi:ABC-type lipoprotein release transport system permease subunit